jgi:Domain of unknown function (DUF6250)
MSYALTVAVCMLLSAVATQPDQSLEHQFTVGKPLYADDFRQDSGQWVSELEKGGSVSAGGGKLDIDVPAGASIWFKPVLRGPVLIQYNARVISAGGTNDRVSDLNCFWMARDSRNPDDLFAVPRSGKFEDYNRLMTYYVGLGGNGNSTTRFRRYIGDPVLRPLLPQFDLRDKDDLIKANMSQLIQLVACGQTIQYYRDGRRIFDYHDDQPYTSGWFAFRTTKNHMQIRSFRVFTLTPNAG